jgi:hypothetical protein
MPSSFTTLDEHLERVADETSKAAGYLVAALAPRFVPRLHDRLEESPTRLAFEFMRQGAHMAFLVTLTALLEQTRQHDRVNLPKLLGLFDDQQVRWTVADHRGLGRDVVYDRVQKLQGRFTRRIEPLIPRANDLRNHVVAHHGLITHWPHSTFGLLTRLMIRVVVLVDAVNELVTGDLTNIRMNIGTVRYQAASLWSKGIDGDLEVGPGVPDDDDDWPGLPDHS